MHLYDIFRIGKSTEEERKISLELERGRRMRRVAPDNGYRLTKVVVKPFEISFW